MPDATIKRLDEMETFFDGLVVRARASLGIMVDQLLKDAGLVTKTQSGSATGS